jgi:outer membrane protein TolC
MPLLPRFARGALPLAVSVIIASPVRAQQPTCHPEPNEASAVCRSGALTLTDAVALAQSRGLSAEASREGLAAARARDRAFNARLLPQVSIGGTAANYNHSIIPVLQGNGATQFVSQSQNESSLGVSISQPLPWLGSTLSVGSYLDRVDLTGATSSRTYTSTPFLISLSQDLFKPRTLMWDVRAQDIRANLAERQYLESREDIAVSTTSAFFDYYAARMALNNALANAAVNDTLYTLNKGRFEVGKIGENDLLQSELQLLRARAAVDGAKLERDRSESALRRLINASITEQAALDSVSARRAETEARLNNGFGASITASYGMNQTSNLFGLAYASPLPRQTFQLQLNMPVFQGGGGRADVQAARASEAQVGSSARATREQLIENARYAALELTQSQRMLAIAAKADTVAQKRFEVAKNRYVIGKIGVSDLYIAQNEKDQALDSYVQALRSFWANYYRLRRVTLYDFARKSELQ